jgi:hypothetical protein
MDSKRPLALMELAHDANGNPVMPTEKEIAAFNDRAVREMRELWHKNTCDNSVYVLKEKVPSVAALFTQRFPYRNILRRLIPIWYTVIRDLYHEWNKRRVNVKRNKILICGTGDSFVKNMLTVHEARQAGFDIMCVDRARPQLMMFGLVPDYTVSLDAQEHVGNWLENIQRREKFFLSFQTHTDVMRLCFKGNGKTYVFNSNDGIYHQRMTEMFGENYHLAFAHCIVMPTAIDLALKMGYKTVATIGTELGWESFNAVESIYRVGAYRIDGPGGEWWTTRAFEEASEGFKIIADALRAANDMYQSEKGFTRRRLIDFSGGLDKGFETMTIQEYLAKEGEI